MHRTLIKKTRICLAVVLLVLCCISCKAGPSYPIRAYLNTLAFKSGIGMSSDEEENRKALIDWKVIERKDLSLLDEALDYDFLSYSICNLLQKEGDPFEVLQSEGFFDRSKKERSKVSEEEALKLIDKAVVLLNQAHFLEAYEETLKEEVKDIDDADLETGDLVYDPERSAYAIVTKTEDGNIKTRKAEYEEIYEDLHIETSSNIDFNQATVIPYGETYEDTSYVNELYHLLSSNDSHVFHTSGFRVSYSLSTSGIDLHISKNENGLNSYFDVSINNVKADLKWNDRKNDLKNCFFSLKFNTTQKLGVSCSRYKNYRLKFKDLDASSFKNLLNSLIVPLNDDEEVSIPLCKVKVPIGNIPGLDLVLDLRIRLYASGKMEFVLRNAHQLGFETRNGKIRYINQHDHDLNCILQASAKGVLSSDLGVEALGVLLADAQLDSGVRGVVRSTLHFYDEEGNVESEASAIPYSGLSEICQYDPDVLVCGDVSLHWLMDLGLNTSRSQMNKLGFSRSFSLLDEEDQIFGNLHHIENGHFVEKCTRNKRVQIKEMETVRSDHIVLDSYAEVLKIDETYQIIVKALPEGYTEEDLLYSSEDASIASVENGVIKALVPGSVRIKVETKDKTHDAYVNILVSTG